MLKLAISSKIMQGFRLEEIIDYTARTGFEGIELWMSQIYTSGLTIRKLKKLAVENGLTYQIHMDTRDVNIASTNPFICKASIKQVLSTIDFAADLGVAILTVHPGKVTEEKEVVSNQDLWNYQIEACAALAERAERKNVVIGLENMEKRPKEYVLTEADLSMIVLAVNNPNLKTTLDVAHLHSAADTVLAVEAWQLPIANVHISQANSKMHLPVFVEEEGGVNYAKIFPLLIEKYNGFVVVEGYQRGIEIENVRKSYEWLRSWNFNHTGEIS